MPFQTGFTYAISDWLFICNFRLVLHICHFRLVSHTMSFHTGFTCSISGWFHILCHYVSPHKMGRHIVFISVVCPSVRSSVCLSHFRVRSLSFVPLVGFTNNFAQMSSMMRRCAVPMFDQDRFKVKVRI